MKKGYMYITSTGYDPERGKPINDPYLGDVPTLGACMPNVRRAVVPGDHIFLVSGSVRDAQQFVVAGFEVAEKIDAEIAYERFPRLRLHVDKDGNKRGNIIVDEYGEQSPLDSHDGFEARIHNYIVGRDPVVLTQPGEICRGRAETMAVLQEVFGKEGLAPINVIGRCSRLDESQIDQVRNWLLRIKRAS
jgi:hypothetical protein